MTFDKSSRSLSAELTEQLVAYLDGELDERTRAAVARRLDEDPAFKSRLEELQQAWEMLGDLPRTTPRDNFARTTVELVAVSTEHEAARAKLAIRKRKWFSLARWGSAVSSPVWQSGISRR